LFPEVDHALRIFDARQNLRHDFRLRLRALRAAVVETHGNAPVFHVFATDDEHRVNAQLFRVGNLRLERCGAEVGVHADHIGAKFVHMGWA